MSQSANKSTDTFTQLYTLQIIFTFTLIRGNCSRVLNIFPIIKIVIRILIVWLGDWWILMPMMYFSEVQNISECRWYLWKAEITEGHDKPGKYSFYIPAQTHQLTFYGWFSKWATLPFEFLCNSAVFSQPSFEGLLYVTINSNSLLLASPQQCKVFPQLNNNSIWQKVCVLHISEALPNIVV